MTLRRLQITVRQEPDQLGMGTLGRPVGRDFVTRRMRAMNARLCASRIWNSVGRDTPY